MPIEAKPMKITTLAPWFGSNRMQPEAVGRAIGRVAWCGVACLGGGPELAHIQTRAGIANDLHRHIINLARVISSAELKSKLIDRLDAMLFHPDELVSAQRVCRNHKTTGRSTGLFSIADAYDPIEPNIEWAAAYAACCWMGRGGEAGKTGELDQPISARWTSSGGSSSRRFRSWIESIEAWHNVCKRWEFTAIDAIEFVGKVKDQDDHAVYVDLPWPDDGDDYVCRITFDYHRRMRDALLRLKFARVIVRYGDHQLIRELYPEQEWTWLRSSTRSQANTEVAETLITKNKLAAVLATKEQT